MSLTRSVTDRDLLYQLAGLTGLGWTGAILVYLGTLIGYGNGLVANPRSLLYLGGVLFVATVGLDRLQRPDPTGRSEPPASGTRGVSRHGGADGAVGGRSPAAYCFARRSSARRSRYVSVDRGTSRWAASSPTSTSRGVS